MTVPDRTLDRRGRALHVLRLSLTARCNLACTYCCPADDEPQDCLDRNARLAVIRAACRLGVRSLRLTGGEPLLCDELEPLLQAIAAGRRNPSDPLAALQDVAITSNGILLTESRAQSLRRSGLDRITISLDAASEETFAAMSGMPGRGQLLLNRVLSGLKAAQEAGFHPSSGALKLNSVIQRNVNDDQILPLADLARRLGLELRFIEYMDVGNRNDWQPAQVIPAAEIVRLIAHRWPLEPLGRSAGSTTRRWRYRDNQSVVGVIASISEPFCGDCSRLRVTADGMAYTCLFAQHGVTLKPWLTPSIDASGLTEAMAALWQMRDDHYSEMRSSTVAKAAPPRAEMVYLGG